MVTVHFLHAGIDKLSNPGVGSDVETRVGSKHLCQAMSWTG